MLVMNWVELLLHVSEKVASRPPPLTFPTRLGLDSPYGQGSRNHRITHGRSPQGTIDPGIPTTPGRSTAGSYRAGGRSHLQGSPEQLS